MGNEITFIGLLQSGLGNLAAYLAAHVLLCLMPAFFIAGAMTALIPKESVTRFLGRNRPKYISYPAALASGSILAVCSCTIVPLFAGIYKKGAGLGPAMAFLFFAPAANILALIYTGGIIGVDLAAARFILSLIFGVSIGIIMALLFRKEDIEHDEETDAMFSGQGKMNKSARMLIMMLVILLIAGTLKVRLLTSTYAVFTLPIHGFDSVQSFLNMLVPYDAAKGEEGVSAQGAILIFLLLIIGVTSWKGIESIFEGFNKWTTAALSVVVLTFICASVGMVPHHAGLDILITGKTIGVTSALFIVVWLIKYRFDTDELSSFLWESWKFVKKIFPLLVIGVFIVGIIRELIQPAWIEALAGKNTVTGNLAGVIFGIFMYFPTLVEVPIANMFLSLGMHKGPLLAYLMADPELSLQSMLMTSAIIGKKKTFAYVCIVALFSTLAGFIYGLWIDGVSIIIIAAVLAGFVVLLSGGLWFSGKRQKK